MIKLKDILLEQAGKFEDGTLTASQQIWDDKYSRMKASRYW
jgi:hypothetical protein